MPRSVTLSLELLQTFVTLIREDGAAAAAMVRLGLNQPTLSKRLKHLQHAGPLLRRPWLVREGKTWKLTDEGRRVWPAVAEIVDRFEGLDAFLEGAESGPAAVRFACGQQMAAGPVRRAFRRFGREHPGLRLRVSTMRGRDRIEAVSNGSLDLAVVTHDEPSILEIARRPLHVEPLARYRLTLVCAAGSGWEERLLALPGGGAPADALVSFPLILPEPDSGVRRGLELILWKRGILGRLDIVLEVGGWATILPYVRDGLGVGVVSDIALGDSRGFAVRPLDSEVFPAIEARLICRRPAGHGGGLDLAESARTWREVLRREIHDR
jgi:DNA-binding transcriptional LysR family regulator